MSAIAEQIFEAVKALPDQQAAEVLDFVEFLKAKVEQDSEERKKKAWATLEKYRGRITIEKFNREDCYDR